MSVSKDKKTGKWKSTFYYTDWTGKKVKKLKRGFATKSEALDWENHFRLEKASNLDMTFGDFYKRYTEDIKPNEALFVLSVCRCYREYRRWHNGCTKIR